MQKLALPVYNIHFTMYQTGAVLVSEDWPMESWLTDLWLDEDMEVTLEPEVPFIMTLIEGVGDEVTICFSCLLLLVMIILAWLSTRVQDPTLIRIVILDRRRLQDFITRITSRHFAAIQNGAIQIQQRVTGNGAARPESETEGAGSVETPPGGSDSSQGADTPSEDSVNPVASAVQQDQADVVDSRTDKAVAPSSDREQYAVIEHKTAGQTDSISLAVTQNSVDSSIPPSPALGQSSTISSQACIQSGTVITSSNTGQSDTTGIGQKNSRSESSSSAQNSDQSKYIVTSQESSLSEAPLQSSAASHGDVATQDPSASNISGRGESSGSLENQQDRMEGHIRIKLKYLDDRQRLVQAKPEETVGDFKRKHFASELAENMIVRFIFRGQELRRDGDSLRSYNVEDNSVIHCLLNRINRPENPANPPRGVDFDIGTLMYPLFALILFLIWYSRFTYKQYFNAVSTLSLLFITFLYFVAVLATFRFGEGREPEITVQTGEIHEVPHEHQD